MSRRNDERRPVKDGGSSSSLARRLKSKPRTPVLPIVWQVYPKVHRVTARSGRERLLLLVRCGHCGDVHQHTAPLGFVHGKRKAACGLGRYALHVRLQAVA